jgi:hypothetical protein
VLLCRTCTSNHVKAEKPLLRLGSKLAGNLREHAGGQGRSAFCSEMQRSRSGEAAEIYLRGCRVVPLVAVPELWLELSVNDPSPSDAEAEFGHGKNRAARSDSFLSLGS